MNALSDKDLHNVLASSAIIAGAESHAVENCLWITGTSKDKGQHRQLFLCVELLESNEIKISLSLATDDIGKSTYMIWGHCQWLTVNELARICHILIESIHSGDGEDIKVMN